MLVHRLVFVILAAYMVHSRISATFTNLTLKTIKGDIKQTAYNKYYSVTVFKGSNQYNYITVDEEIETMYQYRDKKKQYVYPFHLGEMGKRGIWVNFRNNISAEFGWSTRYPNKNGLNCYVMGTINETHRLVKSFMERELTEDNLIFIKVMTYVNNVNLDIRIGNEEYIYGSDLKYLPFPFAFLKGDFERDYKFLPIRLHQFNALVSLQMDHNIVEQDYELTQPRSEVINLNISGDCWRNVSIFTDHRGISHIGPISDWVKESILAHLIQVLNRITYKLKINHGKMWKDHFMNDVCYAEKPEKGRYSVPFHLVQCCSYTKRTIDMPMTPVPIACKSPEGTYDRIRRGIILTIATVFIFTPLLIYFAPAKPRPYKKLRKQQPGSENVTGEPEVSAVSDTKFGNSKDERLVIPNSFI